MKYLNKKTDRCLKLICNTGFEIIKVVINHDEDQNITDASYKVVDSIGEGYTESDRETFEVACGAAADFISSFGEPVSFIGSRPIHK